MPVASRRAVVAWTLYDFANSSVAAIIVATIFPRYFAELVVGNAEGRGDWWWGLVSSVSMIIVAISSPVLGGIADHAGVRKPFFVTLTLASVVSCALLATIGPGMVLGGFLLAVLTLVTYEAAFVYYNSYLPRIAPPEALGRVSAIGFAVGYAGSVVAFLVAIPFALRDAYRPSFVTTALQFALFAIPAFLLLPGDERHAMPLRRAVARGFQETLGTLRQIVVDPARRQMRNFLLAYLVYEDGVNTVIFFAAIFAGHTLGFSFTETILLFMLVQVTALIGSALWAKSTDTRGPKFVVRITLVQWALVTVLAFVVQEKWHFWIVAILAGTGLGAIQAASRTFMATLVPAGREAEFFGFYSLVGKTGAVMGPLVFGGVSFLLAGNQRAAILAIGSFFVIGFVLLARVQAGGPTIIGGGSDAAPPRTPHR
ncbi:MAG: MFS transporter [Candidatus Rokubacteria bacterium]|nr:MFS transporter [Candidatus Rokubacteria bacterium]